MSLSITFIFWKGWTSKYQLKHDPDITARESSRSTTVVSGDRRLRGGCELLWDQYFWGQEENPYNSGFLLLYSNLMVFNYAKWLFIAIVMIYLVNGLFPSISCYCFILLNDCVYYRLLMFIICLMLSLLFIEHFLACGVTVDVNYVIC